MKTTNIRATRTMRNENKKLGGVTEEEEGEKEEEQEDEEGRRRKAEREAGEERYNVGPI